MKPKQSEFDGEGRRATRRSLSLCLLPLLTVVLWAGCKPDAKVAVDTNPAGTYALVSVDGNKVPCTLQHEGHTLAVKSGAFLINPNGTCSSKVVFGSPSGGDFSRDVKATYTRQGPRLTMYWQGAGMTTGMVEGDVFTMNNEGMVFAYRK